MTNAPARFTQVDIRRALKAARAVDHALRVRIEPDGTIVIEEGPEPTSHKPLDARREIRL